MTDALSRRIDLLQQQIELDSTLNTNNKKRYLRGLADLLFGFNKTWQARAISAALAPGWSTPSPRPWNSIRRAGVSNR
ncbi:hypothetical protein ACQ86N_41460 [Puia sp. P3]|uniref:hypothetical protein n=1 Tax=Puia sp. P3 TaxID=3423952 RepID=UPI003D66AE7C